MTSPIKGTELIWVLTGILISSLTGWSLNAYPTSSIEASSAINNRLALQVNTLDNWGEREGRGGGEGRGGEGGREVTWC